MTDAPSSTAIATRELVEVVRELERAIDEAAG